MGGVTGALFTNPVSFIVMFIGVFLFGSVPQKEVFCDYVLANSEEIIAIKRYYFNITDCIFNSDIRNCKCKHKDSLERKVLQRYGESY